MPDPAGVFYDPRGEFLAAKQADPVYRLVGAAGLPADDMSGLDQPVMGTIGYHIRTGKHNVTEYDWQRYMDFADKHYRRRAGTRNDLHLRTRSRRTGRPEPLDRL